MKPWAHESELANYLEVQRSMARARTPATPTYAEAHLPLSSEDFTRLDEITHALHDLRLRLANHDELLAQTDQLIDYLRQLREDFPLQEPEEAFERLQTLRCYLFWLPPNMLKSGESDSGAIAVLSFYNAVALALEPLHPTIGGSYLGGMAVNPLDKLISVLHSRRAAHPSDANTQVALSLLEVPARFLTAYKSRQRQFSHSLDGNRSSPRSPFTITGSQHISSPEIVQPTLYTQAPAHSPASLQVPMTSYFQGASRNSGRAHDSPNFRAQLMSERSMSGEVSLTTPALEYAGVTRGDYNLPTIGYQEEIYPPQYAISSRFVNINQPVWV